MRRVLSVLVENEQGVLSRVAGLFSGRGFNIESLNVAPTLEDGVSLMTITTSGDEQIIEQIVKQLRKLVTVVKVVDFYGMAYVEREMMVIKVHAEESSCCRNSALRSLLARGRSLSGVLCRATTSKTVLKVARRNFRGPLFFWRLSFEMLFLGSKTAAADWISPFFRISVMFLWRGRYCQSLCSCVF